MSHGQSACWEETPCPLVWGVESECRGAVPALLRAASHRALREGACAPTAALSQVTAQRHCCGSQIRVGLSSSVSALGGAVALHREAGHSEPAECSGRAQLASPSGVPTALRRNTEHFHRKRERPVNVLCPWFPVGGLFLPCA
uniref:Uncharacterized protein n=1 Tax=Pipistrellus kuhlii TaxID=59472 RepID=A0A7J7WDD0_PIPKU|nr:hypothetical protein mPipKuh1_008107 [Pipistrellus kuhlii]